MDEKLIREAVEIIKSQYAQDFHSKRLVDSKLQILVDLANSYLSAIESGVPKKYPLIMDSGKPLDCGDNDIRKAINDTIDLFLPLLAKLKMENEELKGQIKDLLMAGYGQSQLKKQEDVRVSWEEIRDKIHSWHETHYTLPLDHNNTIIYECMLAQAIADLINGKG